MLPLVRRSISRAVLAREFLSVLDTKTVWRACISVPKICSCVCRMRVRQLFLRNRSTVLYHRQDSEHDKQLMSASTHGESGVLGGGDGHAEEARRQIDGLDEGDVVGHDDGRLLRGGLPADFLFEVSEHAESVRSINCFCVIVYTSPQTTCLDVEEAEPEHDAPPTELHGPLELSIDRLIVWVMCIHVSPPINGPTFRRFQAQDKPTQPMAIPSIRTTSRQ